MFSFSKGKMIKSFFSKYTTIKEQQKIRFLRRIALLMTIDGLFIIAAFLGAYLLRYSAGEWFGKISQSYTYIPEYLIIGWLMFGLTGMYRTLWRYASVEAVFVIGISALLAVIVPSMFIIAVYSVLPEWTVLVIQTMILLLLVGGSRFSLRIMHTLGSSGRGRSKKRVIIYGAGDGGELVCRDLQRNKDHDLQLIGFIDDDKSKHHSSIHAIPIFGGREIISKIVKEKAIDEIIIAMPSSTGKEIREILDYIKLNVDNAIPIRIVPGINELISSKGPLNQLRQVRVRDLLRRKPVELNREPVRNLINNKIVLISGAGGSIGAEICRQVCQFSPKKVVLFDISEASLYIILDELQSDYGDIEFIPIIGDICNRSFVEKIYFYCTPQIVFHAAAYKHVPLMEINPWSAINNNVLGTKVLCEVSAEYSVERFVMISTDKAVRPTSIMGATKRLCEMIVQSQNKVSKSIYCVVRFGNVMGSSGSVIPKFGRQIKAGGPITITDRRATRYFMLTSEAVQLVMQAATFNHPKSIYILDMGEPVRIVDLAHDMIKLSGLEPEKDIKIEFIGLRPGEKLHEELYHSGYGEKTPVEKIYVTEAPVTDPHNLMSSINTLTKNIYSLSKEDLFYSISQLVQDYHYTPHVKPDGLAAEKKRKKIDIEKKESNLKIA